MFPSSDFIAQLSADLRRDLMAFLPELIVCGGIVALLLARLMAPGVRRHVGILALIIAGGALWSALRLWPAALDAHSAIPNSGQAFGFSGLVVFDLFGLYVRIFLLGFLVLALWLTLVSGIPDRDDAADFSVLVFGATLGMMLMASAAHLLTLFLAVEMASLPSYALAGFLKGRRQGSEAALKYVVYGASTAGIMLYGISLLMAEFGTPRLADISQMIVTNPDGLSLGGVVGTLSVLVGLGFKLSAVPFHFWCPDVFEGAAAEIGAFLSVASKGAALALTARFLFAMAGASRHGAEGVAGSSLALGWAVAGIATATYGNLAALVQTNLKRLLAYSTIAHAGIMMLALVPLGQRMVTPLLYYLTGYLMMNLGAFAVVALIRNATGSEELAAYRGLVRRAPLLALAMTLFLLSLLGLPPLVGFAAKFQVFAMLYEIGRSPLAGDLIGGCYFALLVAAALNTAVSVGYYLRVVRAMTLDDPADPSPITIPRGAAILVALLAAATIAAGLLWGVLTQWTELGAKSFTGLLEAAA